MKLHRWTCRQRRIGLRPRDQHLKSIAETPNRRGPPTLPLWTAGATVGAPSCPSSTVARVK
jgi:hypothetical protein